MIKVYFESSSHAELAAIFDNEETYSICYPMLTKIAESKRMVLTESVEETEITELVAPDPNTISIKWSAIDVKERAKQIEVEITDDQAKEVLSLMDNKHDANIGINWEVIDEWIYYVLEN